MSILDGNNAASIYYTTDGSVPSSASNPYSTPISVSFSTTLRAIAVEDSQTSPVTTGSYSVSLPVSKIAFVTQPSDSTAGTPVQPVVKVELLDGNGNQATGANSTVTLTFQQNGGDVPLAGTTSVAAISGLAAFSDMVVSNAGTGYTLEASVAGLPSAESASFAVVPQLPSEQAAESDSFVDSIGVQTHVSYINTAYGNWTQVMAALKSLGVRHIRDGLPVSSTYVSNFQQMAAAGIRVPAASPCPIHSREPRSAVLFNK